jgi:hypothetical protein
MGFHHTAAILKKPIVFVPLSLALKSFQSRPKGAEQLILFAWD